VTIAVVCFETETHYTEHVEDGEGRTAPDLVQAEIDALMLVKTDGRYAVELWDLNQKNHIRTIFADMSHDRPSSIVAMPPGMTVEIAQICIEGLDWLSERDRPFGAYKKEERETAKRVLQKFIKECTEDDRDQDE